VQGSFAKEACTTACDCRESAQPQKSSPHLQKKTCIFAKEAYKETRQLQRARRPGVAPCLYVFAYIHTWISTFTTHTHTQPPTHPPTHARTYIHIFTHTDLRSQRNRATPLPPLLSPFPLTPKHTHSRCTHLLRDQKGSPPSLPFNTHKTHEAQMSSVLKEPYLSSLGTHVNESWHTRS